MKTLFKTTALLLIVNACISCSTPTDIGQGFEVDELYAPWDETTCQTKFNCYSTAEKFMFSFESADSTLTILDPFTGEKDVEPEDRVEIFFSPDSLMQKGYYCAEMDPMGRILDYKAVFYRQFDYAWNFNTLQIKGTITDNGYNVAGSIDRKELEDLGIDLNNGFFIGVFRGDSKGSRDNICWYSMVPAHVEKPDFHKPDVLMRCIATIKK